MSLHDAPTYQTYRFSRGEYHRLAEMGLFGEDDRVELIDGNIAIMSPIGIRHIITVRALIRAFSAKLSDRCVVDAQNPFILTDYSEPQPDIVLIRPDRAYSAARPSNALLVVEVAESSLGFDRGVKLNLYAGCGVAEVWIFNLLENTIETYTDPSGSTYVTRKVFCRGQQISLRAFPETTFEVTELLPYPVENKD